MVWSGIEENMKNENAAKLIEHAENQIQNINRKREGSLPRVMIAAASSGSGKTLITCGILQAFVNRGLKTASFKCGPDYIDPMFHTKIIGTESRNLDTFFTDGDTTRYLFARTAAGADLSVMEGVMGYYDGMGMDSFEASSYELAKTTGTPVVLVVNCRGMSRSVLPVIAGFVNYRADSGIKGVILNQAPDSLYPQMKKQIEEEIDVKVLGYVPYVKNLIIESRHLGLVSPDEIEDYERKLNGLAEIFETTIDLDGILELAGDVESLAYRAPVIQKVSGKPVIAVARDEAFCFYYKDNLEMLKETGAELIDFSPLRDEQLPEGIDGLLLGGGYPELFASGLSGNGSMRRSIRDAIAGGLPCMAECGGFMYLHDTMEDMEGRQFPMAGVIKGTAYRTSRLKRFGYIRLRSNRDQMVLDKGGMAAGHEFHYFDSTSNGDSFTAMKPDRDKSWDCIHGDADLAAGFPHLYYYSNPDVPFRFLQRCLEARNTRREK